MVLPEGLTDNGRRKSQCREFIGEAATHTRGSGIKLSPASSSRHSVVLTCARTRLRATERG